MFCVTVRFQVAPEQASAFLSRMRKQATDSLRLEPACRRFEVWSDTARPGVVHLHEIYDDSAAFDTHLASRHFRAFDAQVSGWVTGKDVQTWDTDHDIA
jgi:quinol monooxygenase YgiN